MYSIEPVGVVKAAGCVDRGHPSLAFSDMLRVKGEERAVTGLFTSSVCIVSSMISTPKLTPNIVLIIFVFSLY